jgi:hypothetical protein
MTYIVKNRVFVCYRTVRSDDCALKGLSVCASRFDNTMLESGSPS